MSRVGSHSLIGHFRTLFGVGTLSGLGEGALLERFLAHRDEPAFEEILARHGPMVLGICRRWLDDPHDVDDAVQAVFLILVRKAATLRDRNSLANWLFGVSLRVAHRARTNTARRRSRERQDAVGLSLAQTPEHRPADHEMLLVLDEEIRRLPEKQQAAVLLCLVQGKTHEAAAAELSCPVGTVKSRLAGGRATLVRRLSRRGLVPSVVLGTAFTSEHLLAGSIPQDLARQTLDAAVRFATSRSIHGAAVTASVRSLVHGVLSTMRFARMKSIATVLAAVGVLVCVSTALVLARAGHERDLPQPVPPRKVTARATSPKLDLYGDPLPPGAIVRLGTIRHRQEAPIYRIAFTRDDKFVVTDGDDGQLRVWDGHDGNLIRRIAVRVGVLNDFALTSDSRLAVTTGIDFDRERKIASYELATGKELSRTSCNDHPMAEVVSICADRRLIAAGSLEGTFKIIDATTGAVTSERVMEGERVTRIVFSGDGNRIAVGSVQRASGVGRGKIRVFDVKNPRELREVTQLDTPELAFFAYSPDGTTLVVTDMPRLFFHDVASGKQDHFGNAFIDEVAFAPDGQQIVGIRAEGNTFAIWNVVTRESARLLKVSFRSASEVAFSFDQRTIAADGGRNVLHLCDIKSGRERSPLLDAHESQVKQMLLTRDGKTLVTASDDRTIRLWELATGRQLRVLRVDEGPGAICLSGDSRFLIAAMGFRMFACVWDITKNEGPVMLAERDRLGGVPAFPIATRFSDKDQSILVFYDDGVLCRWSLEERRVVNVARFLITPALLPGLSRLNAAVFLAEGRKVAFSGRSSGLHVVDVESRKTIGHYPDATLVVVSPDEKTVAATRTGLDGIFKFKRPGTKHRSSAKFRTSATIALLNAETLEEKLKIQLAGSEVWALAFSPDGKTLAATSGWETGQIHLYEVATGREIRTIDTPATRTPALKFSPDGSKLICGMADTSVLVWDLQAKP